jgi:hypothetical protein
VFLFSHARLDQIRGFAPDADGRVSGPAELHAMLSGTWQWASGVLGVERHGCGRPQDDMPGAALPVPHPPPLDPLWRTLAPPVPRKVREAIASGRPVYVWGAGSAGSRAVQTCSGLDLRAVVDSDAARHGTTVGGLPVQRLEVMLDDAVEGPPFVILASQRHLEMARLLARHGRRAGRDFAVFVTGTDESLAGSHLAPLNEPNRDRCPVTGSAAGAGPPDPHLP